MAASIASTGQAQDEAQEAAHVVEHVGAHEAGVLARVTTAPLEVTHHLGAVADSRCGAVVSFLGQVRDHDPAASGEVIGIEYSAHPDAERVLADIVATLRSEADQPVRIAVSHRVGPLAVGDLALVACVATAHRADAYQLSRELVERIKAELPVWKKQLTRDGGSHWVGL